MTNNIPSLGVKFLNPFFLIKISIPIRKSAGNKYLIRTLLIPINIGEMFASCDTAYSISFFINIVIINILNPKLSIFFLVIIDFTRNIIETTGMIIVVSSINLSLEISTTEYIKIQIKTDSRKIINTISIFFFLIVSLINAINSLPKV